MSLSAIPRELRARVVERDNARCRYCRLSQVGQASTFHVNHVVPRSQGGPTTLDNLVLQYPYCSLHKADKTNAVDPQTQTPAPRFHPLRQEWGTHFRLDDSASMLGMTPVGRATVGALAMNDPLPRTARALPMMLGLM